MCCSPARCIPIEILLENQKLEIQELHLTLCGLSMVMDITETEDNTL